MTLVTVPLKENMQTVRLIHWNAEEADEKAELLRAAGYRAICDLPSGPDYLRKLAQDPPVAVIIDLSRIPSRGRDLALAIRQYKATRLLPLVFAGGDPDKVERTRQILPDAVYTPWSRIRSSLRQATSRAPGKPIVPSLLAGYSGTPLPRKLGIKAGSVVNLVDPPEGFEGTLGNLPEGARLRAGTREPFDLMLWFVRSLDALRCRIAAVAAEISDRPLWIIWPKKTSPLAADLGELEVRSAGLAQGLVDYKVCAVDGTWSGLLFRRRKPL